MAYPAYSSNGGVAAAASGTSVNVPYPGTISAGDILIAQLICDQNSTWQTPSGWTMINEGATINHCSAIFWKRATGSESGTQTFTTNAASTAMISGIMSRFTGCVSSGTPYESAVENHRATTTAEAYAIIPTFDTLGTERLAVYIVTVENDTNVAAVTNWTEQFDINDTTGTDSCHALGTRQYATASTIAEFYPGVSRNNYVSGYGFALLPDTGGISAITASINTSSACSGAMQARGSLISNISTASSLAGLIIGLIYATASIDTASACSATLNGKIYAVSEINTASSCSAQLTGKAALISFISTSSEWSGAMQAKGSLIAEINTASTCSATLSEAGVEPSPIIASIDTSSACTGTIIGNGALISEISTASAFSAQLTGKAALISFINTASDVSGAMQAKGSLIAEINTAGVCSGTIYAYGSNQMDGLAEGVATCDGILIGKGSLISDISTTTSLTGEISVKSLAESAINTFSSCSATLTGKGALISEINTATSCEGILFAQSLSFEYYHLNSLITDEVHKYSTTTDEVLNNSILRLAVSKNSNIDIQKQIISDITLELSIRSILSTNRPGFISSQISTYSLITGTIIAA